MPAIVKLSVESLAEAISSLNLEEKVQLQELLEQQIFEAEEAIYVDDDETNKEIELAKAEAEAGETLTLDRYLSHRQQERFSTGD